MHSPVNLLASLALFFFMALSPLGIAYPTELGNDLTPLNPIPIDGRNKVSLSNLNRRDMIISPRSKTPANLKKRGSPNLPPLCIPVTGQDWRPVWYSDLVGSMQYLTNTDVDGGFDWTFPGRGCWQLDCHLTSTVTVCHDYDVWLSVPFTTIVQYMQDIYNDCQDIVTVDTGGPIFWTGGQLFDTDGWNLIVQNGGCREEDKRALPASEASTNLIPREPGHIDGYSDAAATFILTHNGEEHHLTGTIREVLSQMKALHPGFNLDTTASAIRNLETRQVTQNIYLPPLCMPVQNWQAAPLEGVLQGIAWIESQDAHQFQVGAGWGTCIWLYCLDNASIWLCNDAPSPQSVDPNWVAKHVEYIVEYCTFGAGLAGGQAFDTNGMNVIVKQEENCASPSLKRELPVSDASTSLIPRDPGHIDGYDTFIPRFSISHDGQVHDFNGTVQEALAGMETLYPGYSANLTAKRGTTLEEYADLEPRQWEIDLLPLSVLRIVNPYIENTPHK